MYGVGSLGIDRSERRRIAALAVTTTFTTLVGTGAAARLATRTISGSPATRLAFAASFNCAFGNSGHHFCRHVLDDGLRTGTGNLRLRLKLRLWLTLRPVLLLRTVLLLGPGLLLRRLLVAAITAPFIPTLTATIIPALGVLTVVVIRTVEVLAVAFVIVLAIVAVVIAIAVVALEAFLHLRLGGCDDAVIVLSVLQIVFRHDTIPGALRVARQVGVFFSDMLRRATDFDVRTRAVIGPGQGVLALAVEVAAAIAAAATTTIVVITPPTTLVLLSWPHR
jgi:hypothetical protein